MIMPEFNEELIWTQTQRLTINQKTSQEKVF